MTDLQEAILDRLMAAEQIGAIWQPGPLRLAHEALRASGLTQRKDAARALGFPHTFCSAVAGACEVLPTVDDIRAFSIALFSAVAPRAALPAQTTEKLVEVAYWCLRQVQLLHPPPKRLGDPVLNLLENCLGGDRPMVNIGTLSHHLERAIERLANTRVDYDRTNLALMAFFFGLHAGRRALEEQWPEENAALACLHTGRLASLVEGVKGGTRFCLDLAKVVGL